jgi:Diol dehydratase reactivase ATPase-like domain/DD-reactivating factor swiveling domain
VTEPVIAGVDVGNATTEVVIAAGHPPVRVLGAGRLPTRGRKGSPESLAGAAALVRRLERRLGRQATQARIAPLRAVTTSTLTIPETPPSTGRLRLLTAGVPTPGGTGAWVGVPVWLDSAAGVPVDVPVVAVVPDGLGYQAAAQRLRGMLGEGVQVGAVLVAGDEGVLIANRLPEALPVIDQADPAAVASCAAVAVEVRPPGQPMTLLSDPVALAAAFSLPGGEAADATAMARALLDCSNAVVGCTGGAVPGGAGHSAVPDRAGHSAVPGGAGYRPRAYPWVTAEGTRIPLAEAIGKLGQWPVGAVRALTLAGQETGIDDLFAIDLAAVAETATARRGTLGRAALAASLQRKPDGEDHAGQLAELLGRPVHCLLSEPAAARTGALTTPGAARDAVVVDVGAGTIDVIAPNGEVVAAGAGDLLTAAVAETLAIPKAAAEWVKRSACVRVEGGQRFEAEDGSRGFLGRPAPASAVGMLAVPGPAGPLPFDRVHTPAEWRALRLRLKQAVFAANLRRALATLDVPLCQVLIVGGPAGDDELLGVLLRSLPADVPVGRAEAGATLPHAGGSGLAGHRYAAALGLALGGKD